MKKRIIHVGVLAAIFLAAVLFFEYMTSRGNENLMADIGNATLPRLYFSVGGYGINPMNGYVDTMDLPAVRDTITPVTGGQLVMNVEAGDEKIKSIDYSVYTLDGKTMLTAEDVPKVASQVTLTFDEEAIAEEHILEITVHTEERKIYYYTRVANASNFNLNLCMDYIYNYHEHALAKAENVGVGAALEPTEDMLNNSFDYVNIHSDYDHVTWGDLNPKVAGAERWKIVEATPSYMSVFLQYEVTCDGEENDTDRYVVCEFFRVRRASDGMHLLNYERTMEQLFDGTGSVLNEKGIVLGIRPEEVEYEVNSDGTIVSFVQADELWNYNRDKDELSLLFSFRDAENTDIRNRVPDHTVHILKVDKDGNTTFSVTGYMNRGNHEGRVGAVIYYYDIDANSIEEKAFIPSSKGAAITNEELGGLTYYSAKRDRLYMLNGGELIEVLVDNNRQNTLAEGLSEGQYVMAPTGRKFAYQNGEGDPADQITVMDLESGNQYHVTAPEKESVYPIGFIGDDFICGYAKDEDAGVGQDGQPVIAMYRVEIIDSDNKVQKEYKPDGTYVTGGSTAGAMLTLTRAKKKDDVYAETSPDYIASNEDVESSNIIAESYATDLKETQRRLTFVDGISDRTAKVLKPKQVLHEGLELPALYETGKEERYYVYGLGGLTGIYPKAGTAIHAADQVSGVVIADNGAYVWERGNRYLNYSLSEKEELIGSLADALESGTDPLAAANEISDGNGLDLFGCTTEQILYLVNKGTPVIGTLSDGMNILVTAYTEETVTYMETGSKESKTCTYADLDSMMSATGYCYYGYLD